ncbi:hypothetical protein ACF082_33735 [Streptomyces lydicus]|uniref:hypothetical protein n=1 Tax=Streptomyces lydicus TaxID=47763 RepID=UPI0036FE18E7
MNRATARISTIVTAVLLAALTAVVFDTVRAVANQSNTGRLLAGYAVAWTLFAAAMRAVRKAPARAATALVLAGPAALAPTALAAPPRTSGPIDSPAHSPGVPTRLAPDHKIRSRNSQHFQ